MLTGAHGSPWDWPAKAIKAGDHGNPGGENMLRRDDGTVRYFTVRELARLQTFPDNWHFANSWSESRRQLGNAVPVRMAEILAQGLRDQLLAIGDTPTEQRAGNSSWPGTPPAHRGNGGNGVLFRGRVGLVARLLRVLGWESRQSIVDSVKDHREGALILPEPRRPRTTGVYDIPKRPLSAMTTDTWIVVAKPIHNVCPFDRHHQISRPVGGLID